MALAVVVSLAGIARGYPLTAALNSMQVVPSNNSTARGSCRIDGQVWGGMPYPDQSYFDLNCDFSGLSGPLIDADIRSGRAGQNGESFCRREKQVWVTLPNNGSGTVTIACSDYGFEGYWATKDFHVVLQTSNFPDGEIRGQIKPTILDADVNGEGQTEITVFRPNEGVSYAYCSMTNSTIRKQLDYWNAQTDSTPFLADLDGDGIADWTFIRTDPTDGSMLILYKSSRSDQLMGFQFGNADNGDLHVFADYNGDGKIGVVVFRPSTGNWYSTEGAFSWGEHWGQTGDTPCAGDYDGDGKTDLCLVRPVDGHLVWNIRLSSNNFPYTVYWGLATDTIYPRDPVDIDADGFTDILVSRVEDGKRTFYAFRGLNDPGFALQWGLSTDAVKFGDYDNDGKTDFAAIRETNNQLVWYIHQSSDGQLRVNSWGLPGDK